MVYDKIELHTLASGLSYAKYIYKRKQDLPTLLISHGSGGIGMPVYDLTKLGLDYKYNVIVVDHFTHRDVSSQWWHKIEDNPSMYDRMQDILELSKLESINCLAGISAGGTAVLMASSHITAPAFAIYPSTSPVTISMINAYKSTIVTGEYDDWTTVEHAKYLANFSGSKLIVVPGFHGFMSIGEDRYLPECISLRDKLDTAVYSDNYIPPEPDTRGVTVKYSRKCTLQTRDEFKLFLENVCNN